MICKTEAHIPANEMKFGGNMHTQLVINGLPDKLRLDGWWLSSSETEPTNKTAAPEGRSSKLAQPHYGVILLALFLVFLADWLFWHHDTGVSVAIFSIAMSAAMLFARSGPTPRKEWMLSTAYAVATNLPVIEHLHPLSIGFSIFGVVSLAVWLTMGRLVGLAQGIKVFLKISLKGTPTAFTELWSAKGDLRANEGMTRIVVSWVLPMSFGLVFIWLLVVANPFFEHALVAFADIEIISPDLFMRLLFWCAVLAVIWPYLNLCLYKVAGLHKPLPSASRPLADMKSVVNAPSVRNSLILFNAIFAIQTFLDVSVLSGGMALPDGMSYASYAQRGAYPLVATALLAGAFAIGTRKLIVEDRRLRGLVYLWLLQNLFLVLSAAFRLNLYIETYALTYLRVAAFIWMFMVFVGLVLVFLQISGNKGNIWLITRNGLVLALVLYAACFVNFTHIIASYNMAHPLPGGRIDKYYICRLGPQALPAILQQEDFCHSANRPVFKASENWRDWGFRNWRLKRYLSHEF